MTQPDTIDVAGRPVRKVWVIGGVVVGGGLLYLWYRKKKAAAAAAAVDTSGTTQLDTSTGSVGDTGFTNPVPGASGNGGTVDTTGGTGITDNAQWTQAVLQKFADMGSVYDPLYAAQTLGAYLAGQDLTQDQATLVRAAWAIEGQPPQGAPPITLTQTGSQPGGGSGTPTPPPPPAPTPTPTPPPPAPTPPAPTPMLRKYVNTTPYTTQNPAWNSTLSGIAAHTGQSQANLASWNGLRDPNLIPAHGRIYIDPPTPPSGGSWSGAIAIN